jgi:hypothetical protein
MKLGTVEMESEAQRLRELIVGMRAAYSRGENAMAHARDAAGSAENSPSAILIAYDLQAGAYVAAARSNPAAIHRWCSQLAAILGPLVDGESTLLEVGCGEATTLAGVLGVLGGIDRAPLEALGFDISWSRCAVGRDWLAEQRVAARLFVADLFQIPLADASVDVVYTAHSIEPNGGREEEAIRELLRVARRAVVLIEPIYELGSEPAQARMREHGYVRRLKETAVSLGAEVIDYRLLSDPSNPLNPSGVVHIRKPGAQGRQGPSPEGRAAPVSGSVSWRCPLTNLPLSDLGDVFASFEIGLAYPVLRGIPLLRAQHAVVASKLDAAEGPGSGPGAAE